MPRHVKSIKRVVPRTDRCYVIRQFCFLPHASILRFRLQKPDQGGGIMSMFKLNASPTRRAIVIGTVMAFGLSAFESAHSQEFPKKEIIKIVVPYAAGGPTDTVARLLVPHMQKALKQTVIIENRPGAGSAIGARVVAGAAPDGYTILLGNVSTFAIVPAVMKQPGYDPTKAFAPIVQTSDIGNVLIRSEEHTSELQS